MPKNQTSMNSAKGLYSRPMPQTKTVNAKVGPNSNPNAVKAASNLRKAQATVDSTRGKGM